MNLSWAWVLLGFLKERTTLGFAKFIIISIPHHRLIDSDVIVYAYAIDQRNTSEKSKEG